MNREPVYKEAEKNIKRSGKYQIILEISGIQLSLIYTRWSCYGSL